MTVDDLRARYAEATNAYADFNSTLTKSMTSEQRNKEAKMLADIRFLEQAWWIGKSYGMDAAMLFKLSEGNIDPRHP